MPILRTIMVVGTKGGVAKSTSSQLIAEGLAILADAQADGGDPPYVSVHITTDYKSRVLKHGARPHVSIDARNTDALRAAMKAMTENEMNFLVVVDGGANRNDWDTAMLSLNPSLVIIPATPDANGCSIAFSDAKGTISGEMGSKVDNVWIMPSIWPTVRTRGIRQDANRRLVIEAQAEGMGDWSRYMQPFEDAPSLIAAMDSDRIDDSEATKRRHAGYEKMRQSIAEWLAINAVAAMDGTLEPWDPANDPALTAE
jgi:hypothetical protein